jgi:branched-chain amino acid transport system permease protein
VLEQHLVNGVILGAGYALIAVGLTLVYGILEVVNFAHGELYMVGAYAALSLTLAGAPYGWAAPAAVLAVGAVGWVAYRLAIRPTLGRPYEAAILATLAVSIIVQNGARLIWTATPREVPSPLAYQVVEIGTVAVTSQQILVLGVAAAAFGGLHLLIFHTRMGRAVRACAQSRDGCLMVGVDLRRVAAVTVVIGGALAGLAGVAMAPVYNISPTMGTGAVFKAFAVVIIGGMGNVLGAAAVGLALGLLESLVGGYFTLTARDAVGFLGMIGVLLLRPQGLFARRVRA